MLSNKFSTIAYVVAGLCFTQSPDAHSIRNKRQGLGTFAPARTTNKPFLDTDESSGIYLLADELGLTSAPAIDTAFGTHPTTLPSTTVSIRPTRRRRIFSTIECPSCAGGTMRATSSAPESTTTYPGYLVGSPYPFIMPPADIPFSGSKFNGPWGFPLGHYQAFRGTGQYIAHYQYYPISYFGSVMRPYRYGLSGKK